MGEDSMLLAAYGFQVKLYENNPIIAELLKDALAKNGNPEGFGIFSDSELKENIEENYDISNDEPFAYLEENLQPGDIIVYTSINNGGVVAELIDSNQQYFLNMKYFDWYLTIHSIHKYLLVLYYFLYSKDY